MATDLQVNIASEFKGKKAFKQADSAIDKLGKNAKRMAATLGVAFGTAAVIGYAKKSVKAALEAQAQQQRLAALMKVTVGASNEQIASLNEQAAALEKIGVVSAGNITQTQSQLATFNLQVDTIKRLTPAILDYVTAEKGANASTAEFKSMTNGLAQALNGNYVSLTKTGFILDDVTKKTIATGTESEKVSAIIDVLNSTYKDFNKNLADTPAGQMAKLGNAADDVAVAIGTGIIDSLILLSDNKSIDGLADDMRSFGIQVGNAFRKLAGFVKENETALKNVAAILASMFIGSKITAGIYVVIGALKTLSTTMLILRNTAIGAYIAEMAVLNPLGGLAAAAGITITIYGVIKSLDMLSGKFDEVDQKFKSMGKNPIQTGSYLNTAKKIVKIAKVLTAEELKQLKAKKLKLAIDKANLALGKGEDIFDMDKIQLNAALIGQAEALGKATTGAQLLTIANDIQRLKVKQDIAALEDAIASKDTAAIEKATAKLNADMKILGALQKQDAKLLDINRVLSGMKSTDLINLQNLQDALALLAQFTFPSLCGPTTTKPTTKMPEFLKSGITMIGKTPFVTGSVIDPLASLKTVDDTARATSVLPGYISATEFYTSLTDAQKADLGGYSPGMNTGRGYGAGGGTVVVNVSAGAIGDENIIVDAVQNALNEIARRGYLTTYAGAIAG
jgi:hypothetical protein